METCFNQKLSKKEIYKKLKIVRQAREKIRSEKINTCRICLEEGNLIRPCECTQGYFHKECLNQWRLSHGRNTHKRRNCEICLAEYDYSVHSRSSSRNSPRNLPQTSLQFSFQNKILVFFAPTFLINVICYLLIIIYEVPDFNFYNNDSVKYTCLTVSFINSMMSPAVAWVVRGENRCLECSKHMALQTFIGGSFCVSSIIAMSTLPTIDDFCVLACTTAFVGLNLLCNLFT